MRCLIVLSALVAAAVAAPSFASPGFAAPHFYSGYAAAPAVYAAPAAVSSQYHAQDTLGQYTYGYSAGQSAKTETRAFDGSVAGGYSYVDAKGEVQDVKYTADAVHGFRVTGTDLPVAPAPIDVPAVEAPVPVVDTEEVAKARADHLAAFEEVKNRKVEEIVAPVAPVAAPMTYAAPTPVAYTAPAFADSAYSYPAYNYGSYAAPAISAYNYGYAAPAVKAYTANSYAYTAPEYYPQSYAYAAPAYAQTAYAAPAYAYGVAPVAATSSQYHAQDELGQYSYGYAGGLSAKSEMKSFDGITRGGYSYVDANNKVQTVQYTADAVNGFRVAATNLPVDSGMSPVFSQVNTVVDTPEVEAAKAEHFAAHVEAKGRLAMA